MHTSPQSAALMNRIYRRQRYIYDLTRKYFLLGRDRMIDELNVPDGGRVLEIGCGTGRNLIVAAKKNPQGLFYGFDISNEMLKSARNNINRHNTRERIFLAQGNAINFHPDANFGVARFDRIFMSYTVSMIEPWQMSIEHATSLLAPGGQLHIVDFGQQTKLPGWFGNMLLRWLARFHVEPRSTLEQTLGDLAQKHKLQMDFRPILRDYACLATLSKPVE